MDAPYEHNAGEPYEPCWHNNPRNLNYEHRGWKPGTEIPLEPGELCRKSCCIDDWDDDGNPAWEVFHVPFKANVERPCDRYTNSPYSVRHINSGAVAWLSHMREDGSFMNIHAGTTFADFIDKIKSIGGTVYVPC
jgi:hypothetical protein